MQGDKATGRSNSFIILVSFVICISSHKHGPARPFRVRVLAFNFIAEGDTVVVEAKGDNVTKSGDRYDNEYCMVWRIQNGRITQIKEYCDTALVERVLGPFPKSQLRAAV